MSMHPHTTHVQIHCTYSSVYTGHNTSTPRTPFTYPHTDSMIHDVGPADLQTTTRQTRDQAEAMA